MGYILAMVLQHGKRNKTRRVIKNIKPLIKNLSKKEAIQDDNIPVKILKENVTFFAEYIYIFLQLCNNNF